MINIKTFVFNPFQVNTFLLFDETKECIIIDAACNNQNEFDKLATYIKDNELRPVKYYNTHCHIDHIVGNAFIKNNYTIKLGIHKAGAPFLDHAQSYADSLGFHLEEVVEPDFFVEDNDEISFGNSKLKVLYTPGHADGSICFYAQNEAFVIVGDVLFQGSIGRTDLPSGSFEVLEKSIRTKLYTLPDDVEVYCGHGLSTSIGNEKRTNPFVSE